VNRVGEDLRLVNGRIQADRRDIASARQEFQTAIDADVEYLSSLSDLSSGELKNLASDLVAASLQQSLGRIYGYVQKARGYAERLTSRKKQKPERRETVNRMQRGVDVPFAVVDYPRFLLEQAAVSVQHASVIIQGSLQNLSSNPDLIDRPMTFAYLRTEGEKRLSIDGVLDGREKREGDLKLGVQAAGYGFSLSEGLEDLGLSSLEAGYRLQTEFARSGGGDAAEGQGVLELYDLVIEPVPGQNQLGMILYETLGSLSKVDVTFEYTIEEGKPARVRARSSADTELARAVQERFTGISAQYKDRLREQLTARLASQIQENEALSQAFTDLVQQSEGNLADAADYEAVLAGKRGEVEKRIADTRKQATDAVKSELESQLEKLPLPKLKF
jgi:uncharacterized protein (TIGR03545 family)